MKKRLFIGFDLPNNIREKLKISPDSRLRIVPQKNLHITLLFLGYVEENKIPEIIRIVKTASVKNKVLKIKFEKFIFGPPGKQPRMIWALFEKNPDYEKLNKQLTEGLKEFKPGTYKEQYIHITLARFRKPLTGKNIEEINLPDVELEDFPVQNITLFESILGRGGPVYLKLAEFPLEKI